MAKRTVTGNYRVEVTGTVTLAPIDGAQKIALPVTGTVYPRRLGDFGCMSMSDTMATGDIPGGYQRRCEEIVRSLAKQQPGLTATVVCDSLDECSHCGYEWEVFTQEDAARFPDWDDPIGLPQCCEAAQAEFRAGVA
ncbi:hypothetical protein [Kitasatospora cathayae]|uniref:Uncharacterized protein n=1 Tax=Kitasatospora cathayae TaxID=3004092 RepID=A0ABY7Q9R5_9ACTN|nr:hypothetical protein [Kitasatospora sp. HUAS 3-15]WBP89478.1 hypothetical protein O1G21_29005 [Kitasatospora sp. HUAS 3-15]